MAPEEKDEPGPSLLGKGSLLSPSPKGHKSNSPPTPRSLWLCWASTDPETTNMRGWKYNESKAVESSANAFRRPGLTSPALLSPKPQSSMLQPLEVLCGPLWTPSSSSTSLWYWGPQGRGSSTGQVSWEQGRGEESPLSLLPRLWGSLGLLAQHLLPNSCFHCLAGGTTFSSSEFSDPISHLQFWTHFQLNTGHAYSDTHHSNQPAPNSSPELKEGKDQVSCWPRSCVTTLLLHNFTSYFSQKC